MKRTRKIAALLLTPIAALLAALPAAHGQQRTSKPLSEDDARAVRQTQEMMNNSAEVEKYVNQNPAAQSSHQDVKNLMGQNPEDTAAVYKLASEIFGDMAQKTGGDPALMNQMLAEAMKNPAGFAARFTPEQRAKLKGLADKVESRKPTQAPR